MYFSIKSVAHNVFILRLIYDQIIFTFWNSISALSIILLVLNFTFQFVKNNVFLLIFYVGQ